MNARAMMKRMAVPMLALLAGLGCNQQSGLPSRADTQTAPPPQVASAPARVPQHEGIAALAEGIANGVGEVRETSPEGAKGPVLIFEEYHTSRVGQLQIGVMLLRLHEQHGLRLIGLEGAFQRSRPLDASWFHNAGGESSQSAREDTAVRMLAEGEISAPEFMTMLFKQVQVRGLELEGEYGVKPDSDGSPVAMYLLKIAEKKLTQSDIRKINALITEEKQQEALDYIKNSDPWVRQQFELSSRENISLADLTKQLREIQNEARKLNVVVEPEVRDGLQKTLRFYETATQRSSTMTSYMANLIATGSSTPAAMIIGAAHSREVVEQLRRQGVSFALVRPLAFNPAYANLSMEEFERKNDLKWARVASGTLGRLLNGNRKPPAVIETATAQSYASAYMAVMIVSESAREGRRVPEDVQTRLAGLPSLRIDFGSFKSDGYDVIFRMWLTGVDGRETEVWTRAGTADTREEALSLEEKLLQAVADLGGGGRMPPREPPAGSEGTVGKEGPGDGKRGDLVISRVGMRSLAVFAGSEAKVTEVVRISG